VPIRPLDTLLGFKALSLVSGLTENDRRVAATLLEHFNRKTGRCDPSLGRIAGLLGINTRTVIRSVARLEIAGLLRKHRHGGHLNRNSYEPLWPKLRELGAAWDARFKRDSSARSSVSSGQGQPCHLEGDIAVTQTYPIKNLLNETCSGSRPRKENSRIPGRAYAYEAKLRNTTTSSADVARAEAERRWSDALLKRFGHSPTTYSEIIAAISPEIQLGATNAELQQRGSGLAYIVRRLRLGDDLCPTESLQESWRRSVENDSL
jgi:hypothetical protein